ncbi:hypothetical protein DTO282F9_2488 [Paecilomyces variotii]|nr:hypothetical protein DTO282F9_2488 [Paecilomyces variotii]
MQIAEILSDLTSLRACGHNEAIALVTVHKNIDNAESSRAKSEENQNPDLQRAKDLIDLHYNVKMKHMRGQQPGMVDEGLRKARDDVSRVLWEL